MAEQGLLHGPLWRKLTRSLPESISKLIRKLEQYVRAEDDELQGAPEEEGRGTGDSWLKKLE